ncbi:hypothetical protein [Actinoallomurus acaciae]|uniref:Uncharacterized protein n=1 Tax=Actinoallomurus acaciae TaxID=502577 RepID=A0ABV5YAF4_9ACTN
MAALTGRSSSAFAPAAVGFAGIAGAPDDELGLGDVVVADRVHAAGGRRRLPRSWETAHQLLQLAHDVARARCWTTPPSAGSRTPGVSFRVRRRR